MSAVNAENEKKANSVLAVSSLESAVLQRYEGRSEMSVLPSRKQVINKP
jgi:hypothetical protein